MADRSLIKDLHDGKDRWRIHVRVFRRWNVYPKSSGKELFAITMVLIDSEGNKIQATILNKTLHEKFAKTPVEGKCYFIANFVVSRNVSLYRATTHEYKITFTPFTHIHQEEAPLPCHSYSFFSLPDVLKAKDPKNVDYLIDVIAYVRSMGQLEEFKRDDESKTKLRMILTDNENNDVECVLWDACSNNAYSDYSEHVDPEKPVVVIINMGRVAFPDEGVAYISNSYNATRVLFNPPIKEVKEYIESRLDGSPVIMTPISQSVPSQFSQTSSSTMFLKNHRCQIASIKEKKSGDAFVINCVVQKLESAHGWLYDGCAKCAAKVKDDNGVLKCPTCKRKPDSIEPKLKLHYTVMDDTGTASVVFWDKLAVQLVQNSAAELKQQLKKEDREYDLPDQLDIPVGRRMLIKLKKNDYNDRHPFAGISVMQYTMCEDLIEKFNAANDEEDVADEHPSTEITANTVVDLEDDSVISKMPSSVCLDDDDDEVPLAKLSRKPARGHQHTKRTISKRTLAQTEPPTTTSSNTVKSTQGSIRKIIKKEKP